MAEVEVYTNKGCPACVNVKHFTQERCKLHRKTTRKIEKLILNSPSKREAKQIPQVFIDGEWIGGFDDVVRYDKAGELDWRLGLEEKPNPGILKNSLVI